MRRVEGYETWCALVERLVCQGTHWWGVSTRCVTLGSRRCPAPSDIRGRAAATGDGKLMPTHAYRAHWHAQETVAKTILAAAHAKRLAAQGRLIHVRWAIRRQRAAAARWGEAPRATRAVYGSRFFSITRGTP